MQSGPISTSLPQTNSSKAQQKGEKTVIIPHSKQIPALQLQLPLLVCAPMVDQSELPFRMLTRRYGANLCYTPMLHSRMLLTAKNYLQQHFTTCSQDRPLVAQLCGDDPETMLKAARLLENQVNAIDINLGCPQGIAKRGHYGSYLLDEPQLIVKMVSTMSAGLKVPVFCKIRILPSEEKTLDLVHKLQAAGCSLLTVHGRTKQQNKDKVGACDWKIIARIKSELKIPVVANGGIFCYEDVERCLFETGVDGVMSSEALLENPALFSTEVVCLDKLAAQYLDLAKALPGADSGCIKAHLFKMLFMGLQQHTNLRDRLSKTSDMADFQQIVTEMTERRKNVSLQKKIGWYFRYWKKDKPNTNSNPQNSELAPQQCSQATKNEVQLHPPTEGTALGVVCHEKPNGLSEEQSRQ